MNNSFVYFLFRNKVSRRLLVAAGALILAQFISFRYLYPFPDFDIDSYNYIYAASANLTVNILPIGYSKFLSGLHLLSHSDIVLVSFQYFSLNLTLLYFYFSILYLLQPSRLAGNLIFAFFFLNPLFIYITNTVTNDSILLALSVAWLTNLLWMIARPTRHIILTHAILLFLCCWFGNNLWGYSVVALIAIALSHQKPITKLIGIVLPAIMLTTFIVHTQHVAKQMTSEPQLSLLGGWQIANNALYTYEHLNVDSTKLPNKETREIDRLARPFFNSKYNKSNVNILEIRSQYFIKSPKSPLNQYYSHHFSVNNDSDRVVACGKASIVFRTYGCWLIRHNPFSFLRFFLLPSAAQYLLNDLGSLSSYNQGENDVSPLIQDWFDYQIPNITSVSPTLQSKVLYPYPFLFLFIQLIFLMSIIRYTLIRKTLRHNKSISKLILVFATFVFINFVISVWTTAVEMRNEVFSFIVSTASVVILLDIIAGNRSIARPQTNRHEKQILSFNINHY